VLSSSRPKIRSSRSSINEAKSSKFVVLPRPPGNPESLVSTGTNVLTAGDVYRLQNAVPARYRARAKFVANLSTINEYRQLPIAEGLTTSMVDDAGAVPRMAGWPLIENSVMDGTLNPGEPDFTLLAGDLTHFAIVDRIGAVVELVPHVFGPGRRPTGERGFLLHWRTGSDVLNPDAFRILNHSG
jgi:HK97 family phage major capsid protein